MEIYDKDMTSNPLGQYSFSSSEYYLYFLWNSHIYIGLFQDIA